jgi:predicted dehydrogenase
MGKMGLLHASLVNVIPGARAVAMYDKSPIMKRIAGKAISNINITKNFEDFASCKYDAVYVTTPIPSHHGIIKDIYSSGTTKNIFIEKTLTSTFAQSQELCKMAEAAGSIAMVGYMSRFSHIFQKARALLNEKALGEINSFNAYAYASDFADKKIKVMPDKGGATRDLGAHVIDLSLWFFGDLTAFPKGEQSMVTDGSDSGICFNVVNSSGLTGDIDISWAKEGYRLPEFGIFIKGSEGILKVNSDVVELEKKSGETYHWHRQDFDDNVPFLLGAPEYYRENAHFIECILKGKKAQPDFTIAARVDRLIEQAEGKTGKIHGV